VNLNALPQVYLPKAQPVAGILIPIAIAIVGIGALFYTVPLLQNSIAETDALRAQLPPAQLLVAEHQKAIITLQEQVTQLEPQIVPVEATAGVFEATFTNLGEVRAQVDEDLSQVVNLVPADIALLYGGDTVTIDVGLLDQTEITHSVGQVTVIGRNSDEAAIFRYARALRSSGRFSMVIISSIEAYYEEIIEEDDDEEEIKRGFNFTFILKQ